jgi:8-oxo-dGTP pyrophosphatase MutT (NUDIX family)
MTDYQLNLTKDLSKDQLLSFPAFKRWIETLQHSLSLQKSKQHAFYEAPYKLRSIDVQAVDFFGGDRIGFVKLKAEITNDQGEKLPGSVFLRGPSVALLVTLQPDDAPMGSEDEKHVLLAVQARIPAGSLALPELPAGMVDDSGTFTGAAAKELKEETGLEVPEDQLVDLTSLALEDVEEQSGEKLAKGFYPSPGGSDEFVPIMLYQARVPRDTLQSWQGKLTGLRDHGEKIKLKLIPLRDLWKEGARDAKALSAYALYTSLLREGKI